MDDREAEEAGKPDREPQCQSTLLAEKLHDTLHKPPGKLDTETDENESENAAAFFSFYYKPEPRVICERCTSALALAMTSDHNASEDRSRPMTLLADTRNWCPICSLIWGKFEDSKPHERFDMVTLKLACYHLITRWWLPERNGGNKFKLWVNATVDNSQKLYSRVEFAVRRKRCSPKTFAPPLWSTDKSTGWSALLPAMETTGSLGPLWLASTWIRECETHPGCSVERKNAWVPRRLLDLKVPGRPSHFRIVDGASVRQEEARYMTLSHCWGKKHLLRLTDGTVQLLATGFPVDDLPKTFLEAIKVCLHLKVRYLWIDSLCIKQDDDEDRAIQVPQMTQVYLSSYCNIAAEASEDCSQGLFRSRQAHLLKRLPLFIIPDLTSGQHELHCRHLEWGKWDLVIQSPLNRRAWVFQERLLSPRVLHFTETELLWECRSHRSAESHPHAIPENLFDYHRFSLRHFRPQTEAVSGHNPYQMWADAVSIYTDMELSVADDRPIAIMGLASIIETQLDDQYVAGLWQSQLSTQLGWHVMLFSYALKEVKRTVPSFSWLSLDSRIELCNMSSCCIKVLEIHVGKLSITRNTVRQAGRLRMKGVLIQVYLSPDPNDCYWEFTCPKYHHEPFVGRPSPDVTRPNLPLSSQGEEHRLLLLGMDQEENQTKVEMIFLILEQVCGEVLTFRRIGRLGVELSEDYDALNVLESRERKAKYENSEDRADDPEATTFWLV